MDLGTFEDTDEDGDALKSRSGPAESANSSFSSSVNPTKSSFYITLVKTAFPKWKRFLRRTAPFQSDAAAFS